MKQLSEILKGESATHVRQAAGLQLKNAFDSKDTAVKQQFHLQWLALPVELRQQIKDNVMTNDFIDFLLAYLGKGA